MNETLSNDDGGQHAAAATPFQWKDYQIGYSFVQQQNKNNKDDTVNKHYYATISTTW